MKLRVMKLRTPKMKRSEYQMWFSSYVTYEKIDNKFRIVRKTPQMILNPNTDLVEEIASCDSEDEAKVYVNLLKD